MPNWVMNHVKFGTDKVIKDCVTNKHSHEEFDFNKIIPMPDILEDDNKDKFNAMTQEERLLFLKENDNCDDWYSWRIRFWGTKWNASDTAIINDNNVVFQTAWSMPEPVYKAISEKYHTTVEVEFADEGIVENSGRVVYDNGEEVLYEPWDKDRYDEFWGWGEDNEDES